MSDANSTSATSFVGQEMHYRMEFVEYLPRLRRYARALTGSQEAGDQLVISVLRHIGQLRTAGEKNSKVVLFSVLSKLWNGLVGEQLRNTMTRAEVVNTIDYRLGELQQLSRQAFLLVVLESFSQEDAAEVLQISRAEFDNILVEAMAEVSAQIATTVLIIEDELFVAADLEKILHKLGHVVVKISSTNAEALTVIKDKKPGLILVNIEKTDCSNNGLETVKEIITKDSIPIVYVAAHRDALLMGLRCEPNFFISKPFEPRVVEGVINQALFFNDMKYPVFGKAKQARSYLG